MITFVNVFMLPLLCAAVLLWAHGIETKTDE